MQRCSILPCSVSMLDPSIHQRAVCITEITIIPFDEFLMLFCYRKLVVGRSLPSLRFAESVFHYNS
jgi:hypothetical protein